jgi:hypothetical protein
MHASFYNTSICKPHVIVGPTSSDSFTTNAPRGNGRGSSLQKTMTSWPDSQLCGFLLVYYDSLDA